MNVESNCYQSTINEIEPGTLFAASIADVTTFCLAVSPTENEKILSLLTIWPGHPGMQNKIGLLHGSVISEQPILVYPDAFIAPSPNAAHLDLQLFSSYRGAPVGSLILMGKDFYIQASLGQGKAAFSCKDGDRMVGGQASYERIIFTSWEVMLLGPGGEPHTLCVIDISEEPSR